MKATVLFALLAVGASAALAKLPPPSDEAKAKAAEAAAKAAWTGKVGDYKLCKVMDQVAAAYLADAQKAGKKPEPTATPPCTDPGPFAYTPSEAKPPIEAAGAHSPAKTATDAPSTTTPAAVTMPKK